MFQLLNNMYDPLLRDKAVTELTKNREKYTIGTGDNAENLLGPAVWYGAGIMSIIMQDIVSVYPLLTTENRHAHSKINKAVNSINLLLPVATNKYCRKEFLDSHCCLFLYPFLQINGNTDRVSIFYLRMASLSMICQLLKEEADEHVVHILLTTEMFPLCLRIMEQPTTQSSSSGKSTSETEDSCKIMATYIIEKLLGTEKGLMYACDTPKRFTTICTSLHTIISEKRGDTYVCSHKLFRLAVKCYNSLSTNKDVRLYLADVLPVELKNGTFVSYLEKDASTRKTHLQLLVNIGDDGAKKLSEKQS
ncbi:CCR4-NOT transcription complex subunit 9 [Angomonas deanei]|nr:CCR4-NOT transcription complex subunit 9 [Angomonas deanei]|eukprot:EPY35382.1 CCR4-NOT transcription complex subunit 9 [Angomonas deanei]